MRWFVWCYMGDVVMLVIIYVEFEYGLIVCVNFVWECCYFVVLIEDIFVVFFDVVVV